MSSVWRKYQATINGFGARAEINLPLQRRDGPLRWGLWAGMMQGIKYTATRIDIVNDFYDEIQRAKASYADKPDAMAALDEIESIATWWMNAPAVVQP